MNRLLCPLIAAALGACHNDRWMNIGPPDSSAVGTYQLAFCRSPCRFEDTASAAIRGVLVLDSVRIAIPDSQKEYFGVANASDFATDLRHANPEGACFALHEPSRPRATSAGMPVVRGYPGVAITNWRYSSDSSGLEFELYRSPDAAFRVTAQVSGGTLAGRARAGGMLGEGEFGVRYVIGRRVGVPNPRLCLSAAPGRWTMDSLRHWAQDSLR
jgi:hypothetical protein